jgi:hypothetical protein
MSASDLRGTAARGRTSRARCAITRPCRVAVVALFCRYARRCSFDASSRASCLPRPLVLAASCRRSIPYSVYRQCRNLPEPKTRRRPKSPMQGPEPTRRNPAKSRKLIRRHQPIRGAQPTMTQCFRPRPLPGTALRVVRPALRLPLSVRWFLYLTHQPVQWFKPCLSTPPFFSLSPLPLFILLSLARRCYLSSMESIWN